MTELDGRHHDGGIMRFAIGSTPKFVAHECRSRGLSLRPTFHAKKGGLSMVIQVCEIHECSHYHYTVSDVGARDSERQGHQINI
jgi:hypothetical protein